MNVVRAHMIVSARAHMTIDKLVFLRVKPTGEASGSLVGYVRHAEKPFLNLEARLTSDPGQHLEGVTEFFFLFKRMPVSVGALGAHAPPRTALTVSDGVPRSRRPTDGHFVRCAWQLTGVRVRWDHGFSPQIGVFTAKKFLRLRRAERVGRYHLGLSVTLIEGPPV